MEIASTDMCFACGKKNECGLKLDFKIVNGEASCDFTLDKRFQGWKEIAHGGIVATVLDEAMAWAIMSQGTQAVTAEMNVKYKKPTPIGKKLKVAGRVLEFKHKTIYTSAKVTDGKNVLAEARAVYVKSS